MQKGKFPPGKIRRICICFLFFSFRISYSSLEYCLFKIQYRFFLRPMQPRRSEQEEQNIEYSKSISSGQHSAQNFTLYNFPHPHTTSSYESSIPFPPTVTSIKSLCGGTCIYCAYFISSPSRIR